MLFVWHSPTSAHADLHIFTFTSNWFKLGLLRKEPWKHNSFVFWKMSSDNEVYLSVITVVKEFLKYSSK